jgi:hypothetical protein
MLIPLDFEPVSAAILKVIPIDNEERQQLDQLAQRDAILEQIGGDL